MKDMMVNREVGWEGSKRRLQKDVDMLKGKKMQNCPEKSLKSTIKTAHDYEAELQRGLHILADDAQRASKQTNKSSWKK